MLVLSRKRNESIMIGTIEVMVVGIQGGKVRLGINAPQGVPVHRREVYEAIKRMEQRDVEAQATDQTHGRQAADGTGEPPGAPDHADPADGQQT